MPETNNILYEPCDFNLKKLFLVKDSLTFLVGAGISIEAPSSLKSARQIMEAIIRFGVPEEVVQILLEITNLRFEYLLQEFRDTYDNSLKFLEYFEEFTQPNIIHQFLAEMIQKGQNVLTTNFDSLIERAVGLDRDELRIIITRNDFEAYSNPQRAINEGLLPVYKLHGSLKNAKTDEDTRDSVIATIDALGKHKVKEILSVEEFKLNLLEQVCQERTLVIMGYSGGDDFDIIPTLLRIKGLKRVIWISHSKKMGSSRDFYRISPKSELLSGKIPFMSQEDRILYNIWKLRSIEMIKVVTHTTSLIADLMGVSYRRVDPSVDFDVFHWLTANIPKPTEKEQLFFAAQVLYNYKLLPEALKYFQKAYEIDRQFKNSVGMAKALGKMGSITRELGDVNKALEYFQKAYEIDEGLGNQAGMAIALNKIGIIYRMGKDYQKALEYHQKAYEINTQLDDPMGLTSVLGNIGIVYRQTRQLQKALECHQRAYEIDTKIGNLKGIAAALGNIGIIYEKLRNRKKALEHYRKSYEIDKRLGNLTGMAAAADNIGSVYERMRRRKEALKYYQEAYELYEGLGSLLKMARQLKKIAILYRYMKNPEKSFQYFQKSYILYKDLGLEDTDRIARDLANLKKVLEESGRSKKSNVLCRDFRSS
ncbi:MAG: tetratricopeptide repeat protein [Candidatus Hodarchaeota archaeon]